MKVFYAIVILILSIPTSFFAARFIPQVILPYTEQGIDLAPLLSVLSAGLILAILLYPIRKLLGYVGMIGLMGIGVLWYRGDISKAQIEDYAKRMTSSVTNLNFLGRSMRNEYVILNAALVTPEIKAYSDQFGYGSDKGWGHSFELFKEISLNWKYKKDPPYRELFRPATETIKTKTGDCDDYAICMASCLKAAGYRVRLVHCDGHLYPELYVGSKTALDKYLTEMRNAFPSSRNARVHFRQSGEDYWMNIDYSAPHPGGKYYNDYEFERLEL